MSRKIIGVTVGTNLNPKRLEEYVQDGKSAYELAVENGFKGTEQEWLASLRGADGYTPIKGVDYFDGVNGKDGRDGYTPIKGKDYFDGVDGKDGKDGRDGVDGKTPIKGVDYFTETDKQEIAEQAAELVDIPSVEGFATEEYVNKAIDSIEIPDVDLTDYATKEYVDDVIANIEISGGITEERVNELINEALGVIENGTY